MSLLEPLPLLLFLLSLLTHLKSTPWLTEKVVPDPGAVIFVQGLSFSVFSLDHYKDELLNYHGPAIRLNN